MATNFTEQVSGRWPGELFHTVSLSAEGNSSSSMLLTPDLYPVILAVVLALAIGYALNNSGHVNNAIKAPYEGWTWPSLSRVQYFFRAWPITLEGYHKAKGGIYKLCGGEMLVLPNKYVEELRSLPERKASAIQAAIDNFQGVYSATDVLAESDLHFRVIQRNLTPKLNVLVPILREELAFAMSKEFPQCDNQWAQVKAFPQILFLVSRLASRLFVGAELCRNEEWLEVSRGYTENVFRSIIFLRLFPSWMKPLMSWFDGPSWKTIHYLRKARAMLRPVVLAYRAAAAQPDNCEKPRPKFDNLLQSMEEQAVGDERSPEKLAQRTLVLTLASSHTTSMAACQVLFDICAHPEYIADLRAEIEQAIRDDGGQWQKTTLTRLKKLDSFMKESQRFNPPSMLGFKRAIGEDMTMSDGLKLPRGAHVLMAISPIQFEDPRLQDAETFDGYRYYKMRQQPEHINHHQFATTDKYNLHFGHGAHACPGRFLAANVIKLILVEFLTNYDFRFPEGQGRPKNVPAHEYSFPNPEGVVEFRAIER